MNKFKVFVSKYKFVAISLCLVLVLGVIALTVNFFKNPVRADESTLVAPWGELNLTDNQINELTKVGLLRNNYIDYPLKAAQHIGLTDENFARMTIGEVREIITERNGYEEILNAFKNRQLYPDFSQKESNDSIPYFAYWLNDDGTQYIHFNYIKGCISYITKPHVDSPNSEWTVEELYKWTPEGLRCPVMHLELTDLQKEEFEKIGLWDEGVSYDYNEKYYTLEIAKRLGLVDENFKRMTLDEVKEIVNNSKSWNEIVEALKARQPYADLCMHSFEYDRIVFWLNDAGTEKIYIDECYDDGGWLLSFPGTYGAVANVLVHRMANGISISYVDVQR